MDLIREQENMQNTREDLLCCVVICDKLTGVDAVIWTTCCVCRATTLTSVKFVSFSSRRGLTTESPSIHCRYCSLFIELRQWLHQTMYQPSYTAGTVSRRNCPSSKIQQQISHIADLVTSTTLIYVSPRWQPQLFEPTSCTICCGIVWGRLTLSDREHCWTGQ